jgi:mannose-1-phosphate guanylyltransferase/mannose-6-phosphate isomerase
MAGGFGVRLWPTSSQISSKQFIKLFSGKSLFQLTLLRNQYLGKPIIIVNITQKEIAKAQINEIEIEAEIVVEPLQKNTAPCAIIASIYAKNNNKANVALFPADHYVGDDKLYRETLKQAISSLTNHNICTIGINPYEPNTEYGYIKVEDNNDNDWKITQEFIEKPSLILAKQLLESKDYFWNSGMYFYNADFMLSMSDKFIPDILKTIKDSKNHSTPTSASVTNLKGKDQELNVTTLTKKSYKNIPSVSFDHSIIQKLDKMAFVKAKFDWWDIGSLESLWGVKQKDDNLNYLDGNVTASEVTNSFIKSDGPKITVKGLSNVIVISNGGNVFIASKNKIDSA